MQVATWNTEWRLSSSPAAAVMRERLLAHAPEIVCLTESHLDFLSSWGGHAIVSTTDWGGETYGTRRQVVLWSRNPWYDVDVLGAPELPKGRVCIGSTETSLGTLRIVGLVIPYHMSNVRHGSRDKRMWQLHGEFLAAFPQIAARLGENSLVLGDFNQRRPSRWVPAHMQKALHDALQGLRIVTGGNLPPNGEQVIDHVAIGSALDCREQLVLSNLAGEKQVSDHLGVVVKLDRFLFTTDGR